jgi:hypothetical protein
LVYKKSHEVPFKDLSKFPSSSHNCKISGKIFVHDKNYHNKLIIIIFTKQRIYSNL